MEKFCLLIDDEDQGPNIEKIEREGKKKNLLIKCFQYNVGGINNEHLLENGAIQLDKVMDNFHNEFQGISFDLIAFDWDFNDTVVNGIELIRVFQERKIRLKTPKLLYSGRLKDEIESYFEGYKEEKISFETAWNRVNALVNANIVGFKDRNDYEMGIVKYFDQNQLPTPENIIIRELRKYSSLTFHNIYPPFDNLTLSEIAQIIENDEPKGLKFLSNILELTIAHMIDINKSYE